MAKDDIYPKRVAPISMGHALNAYDVRTFNLDKGRHGQTLFVDGWRPYVDEPGFNADDETWMFASHGPSTFVSNPDILTIGCSITSGIGVPREFSWPYLISGFTGKTLNNCSRPASSASYQIAAAFEMMSEYGRPKEVYALFPDLYRGTAVLPIKSDAPVSHLQKHLLWSGFIGAFVAPEEAVAIFNEEPSDGSKKYKVFTFTDFQGMKYILPSEYFIQHNLESIAHLSMVTKASGIPFKFCSWSSPMNSEFRKLAIHGFAQPINAYNTILETDYIYNKITDFNFSDPNEWTMPADTSCGHQPCSKDQEEVWALGRDNYHPGIHAHIHFAEHFIQQHITQDYIDSLSREF